MLSELAELAGITDVSRVAKAINVSRVSKIVSVARINNAWLGQSALVAWHRCVIV